MIALTFEIHAREPLLATKLEGDPNSAVSYPYVPGSAIRGALVNRFLQNQNNQDLDLAENNEGRRLFFDGSTRYLNAYPLDRLGQRTLPVPLSWFREKTVEMENEATIYDFAVEPANLDEPKGLDDPFCRLFRPELDEDEFLSLEPVQVEFFNPGRQINVHTARERAKGRATKEEGAVFRYEAIAAGVEFGGVLLVSGPEDAKTLTSLLNSGELWVGGSRSGGYGRAYVLNVQEVTEWRETEISHVDLKVGDRLLITFLSDAVLRSNTGAYADGLTHDLLPAPLNTAVEHRAAFKRLDVVGGFNRKWGLPLSQVQAIQAGSVFVFDVKSQIAADDLKKLEAEGIGERQVEGFGRIAINWQLGEPELSVREVPPAHPDDEPEGLSPASKALAQGMVERMLRRELDRRLAGYIQERNLGDLDKWPSNAQLSRLRTIALNALPSCDVARLLGFLLDSNLKARARDQYREARLDQGTRLLDWLGRVVVNAMPTALAQQLLTLLTCLAQKHNTEECQEAQSDLKKLLDWLGATARDILPDTDSDQLLALLSDADLRKRACETFQEASINGVRLTSLLQKRVKQPETIWRRLGKTEDAFYPQIGDAQAELGDDLASEYTIRLVAGLLHWAAKKRVAKEQGHE